MLGADPSSIRLILTKRCEYFEHINARVVLLICNLKNVDDHVCAVPESWDPQHTWVVQRRCNVLEAAKVRTAWLIADTGQGEMTLHGSHVINDACSVHTGDVLESRMSTAGRTREVTKDSIMTS